MVRNGVQLTDPPGSWRSHAPIVDMLQTKERKHGVSHGLAEVGYDIRLKQTIKFAPIRRLGGRMGYSNYQDAENNEEGIGRFTIASAIEEFDMPDDLVGIVHDKSTWARRGLSVFNTVIEPGWKGFLTLELVYHGSSELTIPAGSGIAQVVFHELLSRESYEGKYQHQEDRPVPSVFR